jgi:hypothetical protein
VRRHVFAGAALVACSLAAAIAPYGCRSNACTLLRCDSTHVAITAHVKMPLGAFSSAKTTVCWNESCSTLASAGEAGTTGVALEPQGLLVGDVSAAGEGNDATALHVALQFFTRNSDGTFDYKRQANGDRYRVTVVDVNGKTILEVEKLATYEEYYPNGPDCDPDPCRRVAIDMSAP